MTEKRFYISGVGISDRERKRLYDLKTIDGLISVRDLLNELHEENEQLKLNEQHDRNEKLKSINYQLSIRYHDCEKSLYNGREYLKKLNEKFEKIFGISLENFLNIEYKR